MSDNVINEPKLHSFLYVDEETGDIRDENIETMFVTLFDGEPLDDDFKKTFSMYMNLIAFGKQQDQMIPEETYTDVSVAKATASLMGMLFVKRVERWEHTDEELAHTRYCAILRSPLAIGDQAECYAPTEIYAVLLAIVYTMRKIMEKWRAADPKFIYQT